jgi:hypothetical protein
MPDVVRALVRHKQSERRRHQLTDVLERAWAERAEERFQFGKRLFDRIEIRAVGRQKSQDGSRLLDGGADLRLFVGGEIVEHNHIPRVERRHQDLFDVGEERGVIDRPVEDGRRGQLGAAERRDDSVRLPMAAWGVISDARPPQAARVAA